MILTCPDCATSYFVDDDRVPPGGRTVKCSSCGNRWRAMPEGEAEPVVEAPPPPAPEPVAVEPAPVVAPVAADDLEFVAAPAVSKRRTPPPAKKRPMGLYIGAGVVAILIGTTAALIVMREKVVALVPATAPVFDKLGLPVNTLGLVIEGVTSQAVLQAGRPALSVTGSIRNTGHEATEAPPIRISLLDKHGKVVAELLADPLNAKVPPGGKRYFAVSLPDPPAGAHELEIGFDVGAKRTLPMAEGHGAAAEPEHGAEPAHEAEPAPGGEPAHEPVEAKPLPATSPDALTKHEQHH